MARRKRDSETRELLIDESDQLALVHKSLERWPYQWFFRQRIYRSPEAKAAAADAPV